MAHCRCSREELSQSCRDQSWETQKLLLKFKNQPIPLRWGYNLGCFFFFFFLGPHFHLANLMPVIPAGIWGQFLQTPEWQCPLWSCSSLEKEKHKDPTSLGAQMLSFQPVARGTKKTPKNLKAGDPFPW